MPTNNLGVRCFLCGKVGDYSPENGKVFSATMLKVDSKVGCLCLECLDRLYKINKPFLPGAGEKDPLTSTKQAVLKGKPEKEEKSKKADDLISLVKKWKCLDYSLESYIKLAEKKIFGQANAVKRTLFGLYINQLFNLIDDYGHPAPQRKQIFMIGPTGVGKTYTAEIIAKMMHIPYARSNAEAITSAGYVGDKVESILERLVQAADDDIASAQEGIIIIDEVDKIRKQALSDGRRDINGEAVQQELLKILEPSGVWINHHTTKFDTSHLTIILCGAFVGLEDIIRERLYPKKIGFTDSAPTREDLLSKVENCDLEKYGFIPEFLGRTPYPILLNKLSYENILDIVDEKLIEEDILFKIKGYDLSINPFAKEKIARHVMLQKTGARDVKKESDELLYPLEFLLLCSPPNGSCEIDEYGTASLLCTDKATGKLQLKQVPTTLDYMLEDLPEDEEIDNMEEFHKQLEKLLEEMANS